MPIISALGAMSSRGLGEFAQSQAQTKYIEDYFSTYLYTGSGAAQTISNGIGLADTAEWSTIKTQQNSSETYDVKIDSSGNIILVGYANDGTRAYGFTAKYNSLGSLQWQRKIYLSGGSGRVYSTAINSSGDIYVVGNTATYMFVAKYNSSGTLQWQRTLLQTGQYSTGRGIALDSSGNVYVSGGGNDGTREVLQLAKYNSSGALQWQRKVYQGTLTLYGYGNTVAVDLSDNIYLTGQCHDGTRGYCLTAKYDTSGAIQWQRKFYSTNGSGKGITTDSSGNIYVFLLANDGVTGTFRYLIKYNSSGTIQWQRKFGGSTNEAYGVATDSAGNVYATGRGDDGTGAACQIFKYNSSGTLQWQKGLRESTTYGYKCTVTSSDDLFVTGSATSNSVLYGFSSKLKTDGTTQSGVAFVTIFTTVETSATSTDTDAAGTATDAAGTATDAAGTLTDEAGTTTSSLATQVAVSGAGGLVWMKSRSAIANHALYDTIRGTTKQLVSNLTSGETTESTGLTAFNANGFTIGTLSTINTNAATYSSWTFREQSKFFDIVTYTGNGANRTISHNLGSVPGMIIIKKTSASGDSWIVYHRSLSSASVILELNTSNGTTTDSTYFNGTAPTSTVFSVGTNTATNANGATYIAYLFAHNAGGFGLDGSSNVITCGSYTGNGSATGPIVTLNFEPQFILIKKVGASHWYLFDNMRGIVTGGNDAVLYPNLTDAEASLAYVDLNATGFQLTTANGEVNANAASYVYMAIRRGPMRTPTSGTSVFSPVIYTGDGTTQRIITTGILTDLIIGGDRGNNGVGAGYTSDRLRGQASLYTFDPAAEYVSSVLPKFDIMTGYNNNGATSGAYNASAFNYIRWALKRAPGFFDVVCYTGTGSAATINHNLSVAPELMIVKVRSSTNDWPVYHASVGSNKYLIFNGTNLPQTSAIAWNNTAPTATVFSVGTGGFVNASGSTFVAYLFASCPGVSKVGSYTGNATINTINCGFTGGARYVLIKRTDSTGDWWVWDTARGMVAGTDPRLAYNSTAAETNANWVYTTTGGFQIVTSDATVNANGGTYIYLAIA